MSLYMMKLSLKGFKGITFMKESEELTEKYKHIKHILSALKSEIPITLVSVLLN